LPVRPDLHLRLPESLDLVQAPLARVLNLKPCPNAIIALNEMVGLACLNALFRLNRHVPQDIALVMDLRPRNSVRE
jgi:DNA-binding LacI/PurR family transcriptional regulator